MKKPAAIKHCHSDISISHCIRNTIFSITSFSGGNLLFMKYAVQLVAKCIHKKIKFFEQISIYRCFYYLYKLLLPQRLNTHKYE